MRSLAMLFLLLPLFAAGQGNLKYSADFIPQELQENAHAVIRIQEIEFFV
ncbi:MAG: hypothetical protein HY842_05150, partial [Bacteroidetes bacterium]|nr:hypothetical protein [Bacteroidota bacterium]